MSALKAEWVKANGGAATFMLFILKKKKKKKAFPEAPSWFLLVSDRSGQHHMATLNYHDTIQIIFRTFSFLKKVKTEQKQNKENTHQKPTKEGFL